MNRKSIGLMAALVLLVAGIWWVSAREKTENGEIVIKPETIIESVDPFLPIELKRPVEINWDGFEMETKRKQKRCRLK